MLKGKGLGEEKRGVGEKLGCKRSSRQRLGGGGVDGRNFKIELHFSVFCPRSPAL
jgi:hypothetical protein